MNAPLKDDAEEEKLRAELEFERRLGRQRCEELDQARYKMLFWRHVALGLFLWWLLMVLDRLGFLRRFWKSD